MRPGSGTGARAHRTSWRKWALYPYPAPAWPPAAAGEEAGNPRTSPAASQQPQTTQASSDRARVLSEASVWRGKIFKSWWVTCVIQILSPSSEARLKGDPSKYGHARAWSGINFLGLLKAEVRQPMHRARVKKAKRSPWELPALPDAFTGNICISKSVRGRGGASWPSTLCGPR